jgi:hypothetical protein
VSANCPAWRSKLTSTTFASLCFFAAILIASARVIFAFSKDCKEAPWLDTYLRELLSFPNSKNDDQVDSTVYALAWITEHPEPGILGYYRNQAEAQLQRSNQNKDARVLIPPGPSHWEINGRSMLIPEDRILQVTEEEARIMIGNGCRRIE